MVMAIINAHYDAAALLAGKARTTSRTAAA
jgi:hypothetical protein